ncbi:unnamed protein product [Caenorhabditis auriculariae]|uniref:Uncharacterized protein n=1 Tax=Caenorhabditis auriculariae TaxID=2777116 RepID=A0A8S1GVV1_9PELO|nr:unnamed protein product [Caenorhabditis auriculariae]
MGRAVDRCDTRHDRRRIELRKKVMALRGHNRSVSVRRDQQGPTAARRFPADRPIIETDSVAGHTQNSTSVVSAPRQTTVILMEHLIVDSIATQHLKIALEYARFKQETFSNSAKSGWWMMAAKGERLKKGCRKAAKRQQKVVVHQTPGIQNGMSRLATVALLVLAVLVAHNHATELADGVDATREQKRFDIDFVKREGGDSEFPDFEDKEDVKRFEPFLDESSAEKRFDPFSKRFDPYSKRFDPFSKRFDPYSKRFEPYGKRFDPYSKKFDPYSKRFQNLLIKKFDPYAKRFDPFSKRFDPYSKRFDPFFKRFTIAKRYFSADVRQLLYSLDQSKRNIIDPKAFQIGFGR